MYTIQHLASFIIGVRELGVQDLGFIEQLMVKTQNLLVPGVCLLRGVIGRRHVLYFARD
jgi:nitric oxide reductase large subunit